MSNNHGNKPNGGLLAGIKWGRNIIRERRAAKILEKQIKDKLDKTLKNKEKNDQNERRDDNIEGEKKDPGGHQSSVTARRGIENSKKGETSVDIKEIGVSKKAKEDNNVPQERIKNKQNKVFESIKNNYKIFIFAGLFGTSSYLFYYSIKSNLENLHIPEQNIHCFVKPIIKGDTLAEISKRTDDSIEELMKRNGIRDPKKLQAGISITYCMRI